MADTRSAAGEGSEPKVPAQAEPAHELAKLIAESDAKGKGFWRRLRKPKPAPADPSAPSSTTDAEPPPATDTRAPGTTDAGDPPATDAPAPSTAGAGSPPATADSTSGASDEVTPGTADASEPDATDDVTAAAPKPDAAGAAPDAAEETKPVADETAPVAESKSEADSKADADEASDAEAVGKSEEAEPKSEEVSDAEDPSAEVVADGNDSADGEAAGAETPTADAEDENDEVRPAVGVVYEPDESPDGFPLEYGDIIIGLPKPPEPKKKSKPEHDEAAEAELEDVDAEAEGPGPEATESADAQSDSPDNAQPQSDEPDTDDEQPVGLEAEDAPEAGTPGESATDEEQVVGEAQQPDGESVKHAEEPAAEQEASGEPTPDTEVADPAAPASDPAEDKSADEAPAVADAEPTAEAEQIADPHHTEPTDDSAEAEKQPEAESTGDADAPAEGGPDEDAEPATDGEPSDEASSTGDADDAAEAEDKAEAGSTADAEPAADGELGGEAPSSGAGDEAAGAELAAEVEPAGEALSTEATDESAEAEGAEAGSTGDGDPAGEGDADSAGEGDAGAGEGAVVAEEDAAAVAEKAATEQAAMALITALMRLRGALASSKLPIDVVGADEARQQQKSMLDQLDDYILPRLVQLEAPVLAVVGGSTGAGKSTLVNSLIGQVVSEPGVLRPTTRSPVLIHNPVDAEWFTGDRVLPGMARSTGEKPGGMEDPGQIRLVAADSVPQGLAILDAPDIDSVVEANRELATQLLAAADLWLFVTTAARYADAVPWEFLQSASDRSTAVAVVLDRAPADTIDDITGHLAQMLLERGLGDSPLFSIKETVVDGNGMLPVETVASIKDWLIDLAADAEGRTAVVRRTLHGAVTAMTKKTPAFATAVRAQADTVVELRATAETAYERAVKDIAKATQDGTMLRGEVLARWQEFVGTGELLKGLQTNVGRLRDKVRTAVVGKPPPTRDLNDAVESGLESLLREHAEAAAERAEESWQSLAAGRQLLAAGDKDMGRMSKEFPAAASRAVRDWQGYVLELVRKEGADKRSTARILAYGVNGLGLALMIVIFASTAGLTGTEVGVGAGTAVVGQKLLEAVFGDQAVRSLAAKAREDLDGRVHALMDAEFARYLAVLDQHPVDPDAPRRLTEAARAVEDCT